MNQTPSALRPPASKRDRAASDSLRIASLRPRRSVVDLDENGGPPFFERTRTVGFLSKKKPKLQACVFCSELIPGDRPSKEEHYKTHLIEVTDNNGHQAFTFKCPRCGPQDMSWGGGKSDPQSIAAVAIVGHYLQRHPAEYPSI